MLVALVSLASFLTLFAIAAILTTGWDDVTNY